VNVDGKVPTGGGVTPRMPTPRYAFTLMEMLIVILIIVTLMGLLIPGIGIAIKWSSQAKTSATLGKTSAGLEQYHSLNGGYPMPTKAHLSGAQLFTPPDLDRWTAATTPEPAAGLASGVPSTDGSPELGVTTAVWILWPALQSVNGDEFQRANEQVREMGGQYQDGTPTAAVVDAWKMPIRYLPYRCYPPPTAGATLNTPGWPNQVPRRQSYLLWSAGDNMTDEAWTKNADWAGMPMGGGDDQHNFTN
jgi:type II secretory pathway pseudopilin PulG